MTRITDDAPPTQPPSDTPRLSIRSAVRQCLVAYFEELGETDPDNLYKTVMREVELPLLECVMQHCDDNQTRASACLGISRGTLRKKIADHGLAGS